MELKDYRTIINTKPAGDFRMIKTAYRQLAHKYHLNVNKETDAEIRFKEAAGTWEVLSDEQ